MLMYRVAHKVTARGVYQHVGYCFEENIHIDHEQRDLLMNMANKHSMDEKRTPCLSYDNLLETKECSTNRTSIFGFESIEALKRWFSHEDVELLTSTGFHIIVLEVDKFRRYKKQMITTLDHFLESEVVDTIRLDSI